MRRIAAACIGILLIWPIVSLGQIRTWTDVTGKHKTRAEVLDVKDGVVRLRKAPTGTVIAVPLAKLSKEDRFMAAGSAVSHTFRMWIAYCEERRPQEIVNIEARIARISKILSRRHSDAVGVEARHILSISKKLLKSVKAGGLVPLELLDNLAVGCAGSYSEPLVVRQVIDATTMLVGTNAPGATVDAFLLRGLPTKERADGQLFTCEDVLVVTGTEQYTTVMGGVRTVFLLEVVFDEATVARARELLQTRSAH